jgi:hypothetical protein
MKLVIFKSWLVVIGVATYLLNPSDTCKGGVVVNKLHVPAHEKEIDSYSIHMDAPMKETLKYSEEYLLLIKDEEGDCTCEVSKEIFETMNIGDSLSSQDKDRFK